MHGDSKFLVASFADYVTLQTPVIVQIARETTALDRLFCKTARSLLLGALALNEPAYLPNPS